MKHILPVLLLLLCRAAFAHDPSPTKSSGAGLRVLVYSNTGYYRHVDIPKINRWLVLLGHENGIEVDVTEHWKDLRADELSRYDVLVLNNANELDKVLPEEQRKSVEEWFTKGGKGIVGLHAALVHQTKWPWLNELSGCDFNSDSDFSKAKVMIDPAAKDHPAVKGQPAEFWIEADWTNHDRAVTGKPGFNVLMRVDETTYTPVRDYFKTRNGKPMGADHPIAWTHEPATGGRLFYTEFGHDLRSLSTPFARQHILEAIRWAAKKTVASGKPESQLRAEEERQPGSAQNSNGLQRTLDVTTAGIGIVGNLAFTTNLLSPINATEPKDWKSEKEPEIPQSIRVDRDVTYLAPDRREKADLYLPTLKDGQRVPAVLLMHGGGFNDGDKAKGREVQMAVEMAQHGYVCMSINYRLWNKGVKNPTWPQSVLDAKTAVRWLRVNADRMQIDADRIAAFGNSAGGNLAAMLAVTDERDGFEPAAPMAGVSTRVRCAIDFYGALDLPNYHDMKMFLQTRAENPEVYRKASPVTYVSKDDAPMLLVHGTADETVPHSQAETMAAALKKTGVVHHLEIVPDAPHTFALVSPARDFRPLVFEFLDKHLSPARSSSKKPTDMPFSK